MLPLLLICSSWCRPCRCAHCCLQGHVKGLTMSQGWGLLRMQFCIQVDCCMLSFSLAAVRATSNLSSLRRHSAYAFGGATLDQARAAVIDCYCQYKWSRQANLACLLDSSLAHLAGAHICLWPAPPQAYTPHLFVLVPIVPMAVPHMAYDAFIVTPVGQAWGQEWLHLQSDV